MREAVSNQISVNGFSYLSLFPGLNEETGNEELKDRNENNLLSSNVQVYV